MTYEHGFGLKIEPASGPQEDTALRNSGYYFSWQGVVNGAVALVECSNVEEQVLRECF